MAGGAALSLGWESRLRLSVVMPAAAGLELALALPLLLRVPLSEVVVLLSFERVELRARIFAAPPYAYAVGSIVEEWAADSRARVAGGVNDCVGQPAGQETQAGEQGGSRYKLG